ATRVSTSRGPLRGLETVARQLLPLARKRKANSRGAPRSVVKPVVGVPNEDIDVTSQRELVSSMISERLFDGDLSKRKGTESNILAKGEEWVVKSLATLKGDIQPPFSEAYYKSSDLVLNISRPIFDHNLEIEAQIDFGHNDMVEDDDEEVPFSRKIRGIRGENAPKVVPSDTELLDIHKEAQPLEGLVNLHEQVFDPAILIELGMCQLVDCVALTDWKHLFECHTPYLHEPEVREFYYQMVLLEDKEINSNGHGVDITLSEENIGIILDVPCQGIKSIEGCKPYTNYVQCATKYGNMMRDRVPKNFHKGEQQFYFEFVNKGVEGTIKKTFSRVALIKCECVEGKVMFQGHSTSTDPNEEIDWQRVDNARLTESNASLNEEVNSLNKELLEAHINANNCMNIFMLSFSPSPPPS
ncbi:hypothetical protein MTR67_039325, partial [Solanum verrucosum]